MPRYPQAILVSCEAPWDENERLIEDIFRREVRTVLKQFNHLYIFGTAGDTPWIPPASSKSCASSTRRHGGQMYIRWLG